MTEEQCKAYQSVKSKVNSGANVEFACAMHEVSAVDYREWAGTKKRDLDRVQITQGKSDNELALESLNTTSQTVRNLFVTFVLLLVSISILIASTDVKTLFIDGKINLPLINIGLPASNFFAIAPLLIVVLHANLLFNLYVLYKKFEVNETVGDHLLFPFIFTQVCVNRQLKWSIRIIGISILYIILTVVPISSLLWLQWRFVIYQSDMISLLQWACIFVHIIILSLFLWPMMTKADVTNPKKKVGVLFVFTVYWGGIPYYSFQLLPPERCVYSPKVGDALQCQYSARIGHLKTPATFSFSAGDEFSLFQPTPVWQYNAVKPAGVNWIGLNSNGIDPAGSQSVDTYLERFTRGVKLDQRNFRYLKCNGCSLIRADFRGSDLSGAQLSSTNLSWADFSGVTMVGSEMEGSTLAHATLDNTTIVGADFSGINLVNTKFKDANVWDSDFDSAKFFGTNLSGTTFLNTVLRYVKVSPPASDLLSNVRFYSDLNPYGTAYLWPLYGLEHAEFSGNMDNVHFCNVFAEDIQLKSSTRQKANHNAVFMDFAWFRNAKLKNLKFSRSRFAYLDLTGATLIDVTWEYRYARNTFEQVNVTDTKWLNTELPPALKSAMCITPNADGSVKLPQFLVKDDYPKKQWNVCQEIEEAYIPCDNPDLLSALREKLAKQPIRTCSVFGVGDILVCL